MELSEKAREALLSAASAQDVAATLAAEGIDADDEMARRIWREACARRGEDELSVDELAAVGGGTRRDFGRDGCAATVESGSWCWSNDSCHSWDVVYYNHRATYPCPKCGAGMVPSNSDIRLAKYLACPGCGYYMYNPAYGL